MSVKARSFGKIPYFRLLAICDRIFVIELRDERFL